MNLEHDIEEAWNSLKKDNPLFPYRCCKPAALAMHRKGYEIVVGTVLVDNYYNSAMEFEMPIHYWNKIPNTKINFDITASQLNIHLSKKLPKIFIWTQGQKTIYKTIKINIAPDMVI